MLRHVGKNALPGLAKDVFSGGSAFRNSVASLCSCPVRRTWRPAAETSGCGDHDCAVPQVPLVIQLVVHETLAPGGRGHQRKDQESTFAIAAKVQLLRSVFERLINAIMQQQNQGFSLVPGYPESAGVRDVI